MPVRPGEKHFTTAVFLVSKEEPKRVLLLHHKKFDLWMPPGGHVDPDENPYHSAHREVFEETGIDITPYTKDPWPRGSDGKVIAFPPPDYFLEEVVPPHGDDPEHIHLDHVYVFEIPHSEPVLNEDESHGIRWFTRKEAICQPLFEDVRMILEEIL